MSSICLYNMVNFGPLTAKICWQDLRTPANFNGFCILASLLLRRHSTEVNQTLHDVWPSPALVYLLYIHFWGSCPLTEFCQLQNSLCVQVLHFPKLAALLHDTWALALAKVCGVVQGMELRNFHRGRHLYLAGQSSHCASAQIVV